MLDQAVIDDFDFLLFLNNVPRKGGRFPKIHNRGNVIASTDGKSATISVNSTAKPITIPQGIRIAPQGQSQRNISLKKRKVGDLDEISFSIEIGRNPKFARGIVKIAFSSLTYFLGADLAYSNNFDRIRDYVRNGKGKVTILIKPSSNTEFINQAWPPYMNSNEEYVVCLRIACVEFLVDLSSTGGVGEQLKKSAFEHFGQDSWTYLPLKS